MNKDDGRAPQAAPGSREPSPSVSAASGFDPSRVELEPLAALFDLLRTEIARLCQRAFGTSEGWSRYTIAGELVEVLARRAVPNATADLVRQLRSTDYRISAQTLWEAANVIEAQLRGPKAAPNLSRSNHDGA